ncbi:MAG: SpoIIE family protein phosphatase [Planctomycetota bacterium]
MGEPLAKPSSLPEAMHDAVRFRTAAVLVILLASGGANLIRLIASPGVSFEDEPLGAPIVMGVLILYEAATLIWLKRYSDRRTPLPTKWVYANAVIESAFPTGVGFSITATSEVPLQLVGLGPVSHLYAIFVVLSVLHVRASVSLVAAATACLGLLVMLATSAATEQTVVTDSAGMNRSLEALSATFVLLAGVAAGLVALRMRRYLETAAREAERRMQAERDLQAAALIQQSLMPSEPPRVSGFEIVGWNRPADETGGDYFDWVELGDGKFAICIADVTGHGLGPAMITCFCRAYARTSLRVADRVSSAVQRLNEELINDLSSGRFVTFASVIVTPDDNQVLSTSAGHGPLLVHRHSDGTVLEFGADTVPLGIHAGDDEIHPVTHTLEDGDTFLLVTDGFFEWANRSGKQFGTARLREALKKHGRRPAGDLIAGLLSEVEAFSDGTPQPDDLTAVVIRRVASDSAEPTP